MWRRKKPSRKERQDNKKDNNMDNNMDNKKDNKKDNMDNKKDPTLKAIYYKKAYIKVSPEGKVFQHGKELKQIALGQKRQYRYVNAKMKNGRQVLVNVARAVCTAFKGKPSSKALQVDHIDSNPSNNTSGNLRWATRKQNNSRQHAKQMKAQNAKCTKHTNETLVLFDPKTQQKLFFKNGKSCAKHFSCSHVAVYIKVGTLHKLRGRWLVEWTKTSSLAPEELSSIL